MSVPGQDYFDGLYRQADDPWDYARDPYERRKYALTVAALPRERYRSGYEPGCSVGELSVLLAGRCARLLCVDRAARAAGIAGERVAAAGLADRIVVRHGRFPDDGPGEPVDLVVLSEVLYYRPVDEVPGLLDRAAAMLEPGGTLLLCHWRGRSADHACTGDEVHAAARRWAAGGWGRGTSVVDEGFLVDVYVRR